MSENWLIFVDTNIFLDFYRLRGSSAIKQLKVLEEHSVNLILTEQVQMEYLKHRQRVVLESMNEIKKPIEQKFPPFLDEYQPAQMIKKNIGDAVVQYRKIVEKADRIISNPSGNDDVYRSLMRIFKKENGYCLSRASPEKNRIRSLARKRFSMGYPPKKPNDLSIGDAINWEWLIHCAQKCPKKSNVVIVSRDGDFGMNRGKNFILNDWLKKEFRDRVSKRRKIELTEYLTQAFKKIEVEVTKEDEAEEKDLVTSSRRIKSDISSYDFYSTNLEEAIKRATSARLSFNNALATNPEMVNVLRALSRKTLPDE